MAALDPGQRRIVGRIKAIGRHVGATPKEIKAALETGLVESNLRNLSGGDADSAGWRQERASLYKDPTNLDASIRRFFTETAAVRDKYGSAGSLAAAVQRPAAQYRGRYQERSGEAQRLLGGAGGGGGRAPGIERGGTSSTRTTTETTPGTDNRMARYNLVQSFLQDQGADPVSFATGIQSLKDVPGTTTTSTVRSRTGGGRHPGPGRVGATGDPQLHGSEVKELIFNDGGKGYGIKDGREVDGRSVYSAVWAGHANHVHVAAGPKTTVELGRAARRLGLHVGENPHFGGVSPVHVPDSYHYKGEAIDVSGDKAKMAAFARLVRRYQQGR